MLDGAGNNIMRDNIQRSLEDVHAVCGAEAVPEANGERGDGYSSGLRSTGYRSGDL